MFTTSRARVCGLGDKVGWTVALRNESHKNAHKVAYMPLTRGKIAVCADAGLTIWGLKDVGEAEEQKWYVEKVVKGSFSTMSFSRDGRLIALGSFYSAAISVYDTRMIPPRGLHPV